MIEIRQIGKIYGKKDNTFVALDDVSFSIDEGTRLAIVGKSGSGKSTLMHIMSGLDTATSGSVIMGGRDITMLKKKEVDKFRAQDMSFIFQSFFVQGNETCYENVSMPLEIADVPNRQRKEKIMAALRAVELEDKAKQKAKNLSGGQKQRLAIARAIVNDPKILFADEPTGNLDSATGAVIEKLLFDYSKNYGATLVVVTHDFDLANKCEQQIYLRDGHVVSERDWGKSVKTKYSQKNTKARRIIQ
ncbi:ABC transporter ATP-binding protein [Candidatus Saccharibacteria bacterium]|nr:ABC transporter ATP-binding protein [Candidatus Saccharibacteria bacterium]NCU40269.1 ABC transporter ATP-binding protein [Candidatus Saccharibacteria bacterium]